MIVTHSDKELAATQLETRAQSLALAGLEVERLRLLQSKSGSGPGSLGALQPKDLKLKDRYAKDNGVIDEDDEMREIFGDEADDNEDYT
jgi:hypothetical protein